jgi:hypothetical protein
MKMTNKEILEAARCIGLLLTQKIKLRLAFKLEGLRRGLVPALESYDKRVNQIKASHALKDENGRIIPSKDENGKEVPNTMVFETKNIGQMNAEISEILGKEEEVTLNPLSISEFGEDVELSPAILRGMFKVLSE